MPRSEFDWSEVPYPENLQGQTSTLPIDESDHAPHLFLYVPDLGSETGWVGHRVPERRGESKAERRAMGFRR